MVFNSPGVDTYTHAHIPTSRTKARAWFNKLKKQQLTQHTIALTFEWINPLCHRPTKYLQLEQHSDDMALSN